MAPLTLEVRQNSDGAIECWDDDEELQCYEDIHLRTASSATSVTNSSVRRSGHRDSISSRRSARSDLDSTAGGDEDWQIQLLSDDELVNEEAIASVKNVGIPLPTDVPRTALVGGTIKRLGKKKTKREFIDDWSDDLELPDPHVALELKQFHDTSLPEALLNIGPTSANPAEASPQSLDDGVAPDNLLDDFPDNLGSINSQNTPTIRAAKQRSPQLPSIASDFEPSKGICPVETFEDDFELPSDNLLRLRLPLARASSPAPEDVDVDWSEGSIGVRFGGTTRDHLSNPSSSISVVSPSASSYLTGESDDEGLDGLVIPEGPLDLGARLNQPRKPIVPDASQRGPENNGQTQPRADDFFSDLEVNSDDVFNPKRPSINPNVRCKAEPPGSPARRSATTLTFTNATSPKTRIPRLSGHDRTHSTHLETVSESGAPLSKFRTSPRRPGHVSHSSVSSLPVSGPAALSPIPFTPTRRLVGTRISKEALADERIAGKHLLKTKRSMPSMRNASQSNPSASLPSPPRHGGSSWLNSRRFAAIDRTGLEAKLSARKPQAPFLPAGSSDKQSQHASIKNYRYSRRTSSDGTNDTISSQGTVVRLSRPSRHEGSRSKSNDTTLETLSTTPKGTITRPARRRDYGDGTELASFDDLPTSTVTESKYVKQPSGRGAPRSLKSKLSTSQPAPSKPDVLTQPGPTTSIPVRQQASVPRFARDTNASRNAREQRIASMSSIPKLRENTPLTPLNSNWRSSNVSRVPSTTGSIRSKKGKSGSISGSRPQLIKPIGAGVQERKSVNGMHYNPVSFRWEGNENLVHGFDSTAPKSPKSSPALITNVGAMQNVQVVGGMVFDPQRMCWLKLAASQPGGDGVVAVEDEDDVFSNLADLNEFGASGKRGSEALDDIGPTASGDDRSGEDSSDEWPMTEEFDVGPEFIRRQHTEEEKWRRKVDKWMNHHHAGFESNWRWAIRDLVKSNSTLGAQELINP
ncbi:putative cytokinesis regulator (Byr4) [Aspergillus undulatus]|uniref:putative cytokinesis regulator (Byr4) n=1 Tax=Aspergillus undulatus TaxID=1810928 RepID=UPI003CCE474F